MEFFIKSKIFILAVVILTSFIFIKSSLGGNSISAAVNSSIPSATGTKSVSISGDFDIDVICKAYFEPRGLNDDCGEVSCHSWSAPGGISGSHNKYLTPTDEFSFTATGPGTLEVKVSKMEIMSYLQVITYAQTKMLW